MSDLIRRQDAELILAREMYATSLEDGCDPVSPVDFLPEAKAWMSDAPAMCGWIPCSERLPNDMTYVLTTIHIPGREPVVRSGVYENGLFHNDNGDVWKATDREVLAWLPLPEPYKAS